MSRPDVMHDVATRLVTDVSADGVRHLQSLYTLPTQVRRENLLALAQAAHAYPRYYNSLEGQGAIRKAVSYYAATPDPMPPFGRLLRAVRDGNAVEVDKALHRLTSGDDA